MKLLFAIKSLNVHGGGAERVFVDIVNELAQRNHEIAVLTFDSPGVPFYTLNSKIKRLETGIAQPGKSTPRLGFMRSIGKIRRAIIAEHADLIVAFMHSTYVPIVAALIGSRERVVISEHVDATHFQTRPLQRVLVRLCEQIAIAKTVPSEALLHQHSPAVRRFVHVLPNTVDIDTFIACQTTHPVQPPVILTVGRLMAEKNHLDLIRAFALLADEFPDWSLKIVGDGVLRSQLEGEITRLGLQQRITMPGVVRDVTKEYAGSSFVVLPSLYESFGLVAAEALASGRALLAFDHCLGIAEMVESGRNGLLVTAKPDRITSLADGMKRLMTDRKLREHLAAAGPPSVQRYAMMNVITQWEKWLLDHVAVHKPHGAAS